MLENAGLARLRCVSWEFRQSKCDLSEWNDACRIKTVPRSDGFLVGKYVKLHDSYLSIAEALRHAG